MLMEKELVRQIFFLISKLIFIFPFLISYVSVSGCREGEGVLPPRGDSLHHHPAGVRGDGAPQLPRLHGGLRPRLP